MKQTYWIILFAVILILHLAGIQFHQQTIEKISKPLVALILIAYFIFTTGKEASNLKKWSVAALFFSWVGDILLMFQDRDPLFFLLGLSAFLIAHIFYIVLFYSIRIRERIRLNGWLVLVVIAYYAFMVTILYSHLGDMKIPVLIYAVVICMMLLLSMHMVFMRNRIAGYWMVAGAILFVISDSLLALNKFYQPFASAGLLVMITYGLAQLFLTVGAIRYIGSDHKV